MPPDPESQPVGARPEGDGLGQAVPQEGSDRHRLEQEVQLNHQRFQALVQHSWDILSILDADGRLLYNSPACERIHGFTPEELLGRSTADLIHPEDAPRVGQAMGWLLAHPGEPATVEYRYACKDGHWVWMEAVGVNFLDDPSIRGIVVNSRDITERKHAEKALRASDAMFRELLERQGEGFAMVDAEERFIFANPVAETIFGVSPGSLPGRNLLDFLDDAQQQQVHEGTEERRAGRGDTYELEIRRPSGERRTILVTATPRSTEGSQGLQVIGVFRDITEARRADLALQEEKDRLSLIFHGSHDAIYLSDIETGHFLDVNEAFERTTGYTRGQVLGRNSVELGLWFDLVDRTAYFAELQASGHVRNRLIRIRHREGGEIWAECTSSLLEQGGRPCMVTTARDVTERIQANLALQQSEQTLLRLLEAASIPIGVANARGEIEYLNPRFLQDLAYRREDLPDMEAWWTRAYPDLVYRQQAQQAWNEAYSRALTDGGHVVMDQVFRITCGNGQVRLVEIRGAVAGKRIIVFLQDLTKRLQAEGALRDVLELNERMVTSQPMGVVAFHAESGRCVRANEAMARTVGGSVEQILSLNFREMVSWRDSGMLATAERVLATGIEEHQEVQVQSTFGRSCWLSNFFSVFHANGDRHLLVLCEDITTRREAENALRKASAAVEQSPAAIVITDTLGNIEYVNAAFTRITGYAAEEAIGQNPRFLKSGLHDVAFYQDLWRTIGEGRTWRGRLRNRRKDGSLYWEEASISPLRDEAGGITHFVASKLDVTEMVEAAEAHRLLEVQVARTQKLESLGSLAGGVAHDMNNVLAAILGMASVHQMLQPEGSALRRDMDTIVKACQRGGTLVKGLLGFARQELAEVLEVDLNSLVREEVALLSRTTLQRVQLEMDLAEGRVMVRGDAASLSHVLMNLCVNAVDAMEGTGRLTLRTTRPGTGMVILEVADTGCGMTRDILDRALDPFFTTKPQGKGTGLGLPIVYGTVKAHQGRMEIASVPGQGTCVRLFLPALEVQAIPAEPGPAEGPPRRCLEVLVVDDDELVRESVMQVLCALGHRPTGADSGEEALRQLSAGLNTDVVLLDLNMPGLGGAATLPRIRELRPDLPVLLATGRVDQEALNLVHHVPGVWLMPKPFTLADVRQQLEPFSGC